MRTRLARITTSSAGAAALLAYAWFATGLRPFASTTAAVVVGSGALAMAVGRALPPIPRRAITHSGAAAWVVLLGLLAAWQLLAWSQHPRSDHPTLSSLTNSLLDTHASRALAFVAWLAAAVALARR